MIPDAILNKPGCLNPAEYEEVCHHPEYGRGMVTALIPWLGESARAIWEHHERWDGGGYPAGLAGLDIALAARIVNVADTFDVMTSARSYKEPVSPADSRAELARCANGQFDPEVVRAVLNISIGQLECYGPISWLAQVTVFPRRATGSVGGNAATVAAPSPCSAPRQSPHGSSTHRSGAAGVKADTATSSNRAGATAADARRTVTVHHVGGSWSDAQFRVAPSPIRTRDRGGASVATSSPPGPPV